MTPWGVPPPRVGCLRKNLAEIPPAIFGIAGTLVIVGMTLLRWGVQGIPTPPSQGWRPSLSSRSIPHRTSTPQKAILSHPFFKHLTYLCPRRALSTFWMNSGGKKIWLKICTRLKISSVGHCSDGMGNPPTRSSTERGSRLFLTFLFLNPTASPHF